MHAHPLLPSIRRFMVGSILALAVMVPASHGRVFWRSPAHTDGRRALDALGGRIAYEAPVIINGGRGHLSVFAFTEPLADVVRRLSQTPGGGAITYSGGTLAVGERANGKRIVRMVAFSLDPPGETLVCALDQSVEERERSRQPPGEEGLPGVPGFPGARTVFTAVNEESRMRLTHASTEAPVSAVRDFYHTALAAAGWSAFGPGSGTATVNGSGMGVYLKDHEILCVLANRPHPAGPTDITLLHKRHGLE